MQWPAGVNPGNTLRAIEEYRVQIPGRLLGLVRIGVAWSVQVRRGMARQGLEMVAMVHLWFDSMGYHCWPGWTRYGSAGRGIGVVRPV